MAACLSVNLHCPYHHEIPNAGNLRGKTQKSNIACCAAEIALITHLTTNWDYEFFTQTNEEMT